MSELAQLETLRRVLDRCRAATPDDHFAKDSTTLALRRAVDAVLAEASSEAGETP